jgi:eukaryotic-like serine/threonine-protein kinase
LKAHRPPLVAGKYHLKDRLGQGAHGTVYRATHVDLGEDVALKLLNVEVASDEKTQKRFLREVKLATSFVHKYAVQLRDFGRERDMGCLYFTMDLVPGPTLEELVTNEGVLDERPAIHLFSQVLEALEEAHRAGIVHRDLKPANLIVTAGPNNEAEIRILDFGVAKAVSGARQAFSGSLTMVGTLVGTLHYMSPEQAQGLEIDTRSDLYSLAVVFYEALTGRKPTVADRKAELAMQSFLFRLQSVMPKPVRAYAPHVSAELEAVLMRCLSKKPKDRYQTARAFRKALKRVPVSRAKKRRGARPKRDGKAVPEDRTHSDSTRSESSHSESSHSDVNDTLPKPRRHSSGSNKVLDGLPVARPVSGRKRSQRAKADKKEWRQKSHSKRTRKASSLPEGIVPGPRKGEFLCERDGSILRWVPPSTFRMGEDRSGRGKQKGRADRSQSKAAPSHEVTLSRGYFVAKKPVTWRQYRRFCLKTDRKPPGTVYFKHLGEISITDRHPAVNVSFTDALAYCRWAGLRLPTEAEWEYAARGSDGRSFPWGKSEPSPSLLNWRAHPTFGRAATCPVGCFPKSLSPFGCLDMAGNVWEWVNDWYGPYKGSPTRNPRGPRSGRGRVVRGGCWQSEIAHCQTTSRFAVDPAERRNSVGFRVCRSG